MRRTTACLAAAIAPIVASIGFARAQSIEYTALSQIRFPLATPRVTAFPITSPPINGFVPQMVFGLTNEQDPNDELFSAHVSSSPAGTTLPSGGAPKYFTATLDTGSQSHIITEATYNAFNIDGAGRAGNFQAE